MTRTFTSSLCVLASLTAVANADVGVVEATGQFQLPGGSSATYVSAIGFPSNPRLNGYDFGSVNALTGQTLLLQNWYFENYAYNGGGTPPGGTTNNNWLDGANVASLVVTVLQGSSSMAHDAAAVAILPGYRQIIDLADFDRSVFQLSTGNSGIPGHARYGDCIPEFLAGRYRPLLYSRDAHTAIPH